MDDRIALVTGAGKGIGADIARELARRGHDVVVNDITMEDGARAVAEEIAGTGRQAMAIEADVGDAQAVEEMLDTIEEAFGAPPNVIVNNAGVQVWGHLLDLAEEDWDRVIRTNLKGSFLVTQRAARRLVARNRPGAVVNLGSACNSRAFPRLVSYTASKGGIEMLTKVAAVELGPYRIRVNCVAPGAIETERTRLEDPDYAGLWGAFAPLRRVGTPTDVARAVAFFASPVADYVSGQTLYVDGAVFAQANWPYADDTP